MDDLKDIRERIIALEVESRERWKAHDEKSDVIWHEIKADIKALFSKMSERLGQKDICMEETRGYTNKIVALAIGIPLTLLFILAIVEKTIK